MSVISQLLFIDALGPKGAYRAHNRLAVADVAGHPLAELSLVPRLFVTRAMTALQKAQTLPSRTAWPRSPRPASCSQRETSTACPPPSTSIR